MNGNNAKAPRVTVLMPVYNGENHLREAMESILSQTFRDYEFLIIDDGSTDGSPAIIESFRDRRIRFERNPANLGLIRTLNRGLDLAGGDYIARMDCDDISLPERLARQVAFLDSHPEVVACGSWFRKVDAVNKPVCPNTSPDRIRCGLLFDSMVAHPTVVMRRDVLEKYSLRYEPEYGSAEDYRLWLRVADHGDIANLGEILLHYRVHPAQVSMRMTQEQRLSAGKVRLEQLLRLGLTPSREEFELHQAIAACCFPDLPGLFPLAEEWLCKLKTANDMAKVYPEPAFSRILVERWLTFCKKGLFKGHCSPRMLFFSRLSSATGLGKGFMMRFVLEEIGRRAGFRLR